MILNEILTHKRTEVEKAKRATPTADLRREAEAVRSPGGRFKEAIAGGKEIALIAEVKKASPSKGVIRPDFDPVELAKAYAAAGASAVSVLTDERFFMGSLEHLQAVRKAVPLPILRKEFIVDPHQLYEAKVCGADAVLLIVAALRSEELADLLQLARELGLDALVEVHTEEELETAAGAGADIVGINNRDLRTFETTLEVTARLAPRVPKGATLVSESGIYRREDLAFLSEHGVDAVLVGEALARERDVQAKVRELIGVARGSA